MSMDVSNCSSKHTASKTVISSSCGSVTLAGTSLESNSMSMNTITSSVCSQIISLEWDLHHTAVSQENLPSLLNYVKELWSIGTSIQHIATNLEEKITSHIKNCSASTKSQKCTSSSSVKPKWSCDTCQLSFQSTSLLKEHKKAVHDLELFTCTEPDCAKTFNRKSTWRLHVRWHTENKTKMCDQCSKVFLHESEVCQHMATHSSEKRYICEKCDKWFTHKSELNCHVKSCGIRVQCSECNRTFKNEKNLKEHVKTKHVEHENWKFICDLCPEKPCFQYRQTFQHHNLQHHVNNLF